MLHSQEKLTPEQKQMARRRRILQGRAAQGICILAAFAAISLFAAGWLLLRQPAALNSVRRFHRLTWVK